MPTDFTRYNCQIMLPGFGELAQRMLQNARVLVAGAGGLGCPAAQYLVAAGVGTVGIADHDHITLGNLHRQILYTPRQEGNKKAFVACTKLQQQNPDIQLFPHNLKLTDLNVMDIISQYDMVLDCTDNFETRYLLNDACVLAGIPLVYGAIYQYEGQVAVWNVRNSDNTISANYRDFFPEVDETNIPNCNEGGVLPTLAGIIGCMQANEAIKFITDTGELLAGKLLVFDALTMQSRIVKGQRVTGTNITELPKTSEILTITADELKANLDGYLLIDVRTPAEHEQYNIGGINIPLERIDDLAQFLDKDKPIVLYCAQGKRSAEAIKIINMLFIAEIFSLKGGLAEWAR